ncbi:glycoside hydrolase family 68 protein [Actinobaculum sp. 352]|uniref:glycoside hydrolase family 68 protein n=1 Tax=Actinobaculum sp. 352 TaxID=2490946 RepID=UPI000F7E1632|nr:glycoside hydrolase family 68 protein [Actinobaculum sp. 352]RTE48716.1 glycosyl hydrolase family 32 [Actinobaculum sp. 352]
MSLHLRDKWVWDSWPVIDDDGARHLFYLQASRSLGDPEARHMHPSIGHAISTDWRRWRVLPDALAPAPRNSWDDATTWTGSIVRGPSGMYHLFYTGSTYSENCRVQRIGRADSTDLIHWERFGNSPLVEADRRWYEKYTPGTGWHDEAWRDPWVFEDPAGNGWHMLITARANHGELFGRGVVGHAFSTDLENWEVREPLSTPSKFGQMEVTQSILLDGEPVLVFCCLPREFNTARHPLGQRGGMWIARGESLLGPWDIDGARRVDHPSLYAARVIEDIDGIARLLGFADHEAGAFRGEILDPVDILLEADADRVEA